MYLYNFEEKHTDTHIYYLTSSSVEAEISRCDSRTYILLANRV